MKADSSVYRMASDDSAPTVSLVSAAKAGDRDALGTLCQRVLPDLTAFVRARFSGIPEPRESVSDCVQSVLCNVFSGLDRFDPTEHDNFRAWVYAVAICKLRDKKRYHGALRRDARREARQPLAGRPDPALSRPDWRPSPLTEALQVEEVKRVVVAIGELSPRQRQALDLHLLHEMSYKDIAARLGCREQNVRQAVSRGLRALARAMAKGSRTAQN